MRLPVLIIVAVWLGLATGCGVDESDLEGAACVVGAQSPCGTVLFCDQETSRCTSGKHGGGGSGGGGGASP